VANRNAVFLGVNWWPVARLVGLGTLACIGFSVLLNYLLLFVQIDPFTRSMATAVVLPLFLAVPLFSVLAVKLQDIRNLRQELNNLATLDRVTSCFTGTAFSAFVGGTLTLERRKPSKGNQGALLVLDLEHLNAINARFGHNWGDEALRLIASVIRSSIRSSDVVGRVGSSEFGIFLPDASEENAVEIAERIRAAVANAYFAPQGRRDALTVSVGGIIYRDQVDFGEMFRAAEQQMHKAKNDGARQLELSHLPPAAEARPLQN
jgi:diguanylate cyclase